MTIVVDASVAVRWLFRFDPVESAESIVGPGQTFIAPDLIFPEIASAAWKLVTFGNFPAESVAAALSEAPRIFDEIVPSVQLADRAFSIGVELRHPVYDCFYLALAELRDCEMTTADERLLGRCAHTIFSKRLRPLVTAPSSRRR